MKKIIFAVCMLVAFTSKAQRLDTVIVRNLTLQAQDWGYLIGSVVGTRDSATLLGLRRIRTKVQQSIPQTWTVNITVDSLPGSVVLQFYSITANAPTTEIGTRATPILNAIAGKANMVFWLTGIDATGPGEFTRKRNIGKYYAIDQ